MAGGKRDVVRPCAVCRDQRCRHHWVYSVYDPGGCGGDVGGGPVVHQACIGMSADSTPPLRARRLLPLSRW